MVKSSKLPRWLEVWGPVALVLTAMWVMTTDMADRLTAQIETNRQAIEANRQAIGANRQAIETNLRAINALGREVSELRGELKGRDLIEGMEDR